MIERLVMSDFELNTLDDVVNCFTTLERRFNEARDKRAVFATAYLTITRAMKSGIESGRFGDDDWVGIYLRSFARLYVEALRDYEEGDLARVPRAWRVAFDLGAAREGLIIQHLVLGINAHVNHDLPIALANAGIDPQRPRRYDDHTSVNVVLGATLDALQDHVERLYSPVLRLFDNLLGRWDDEFSFTMVKNAREHAWLACLDLVEARDEDERALARRRVDDASGELAEMIARPLRNIPNLLVSLCSLESHSPLALLLRRPGPDERHYAEEDLLPSLDGLHERLAEVVEQYDNNGSEMAVYPAFYRLWLRILSSAVQEGMFADPDWIVQLELRCAASYLHALSHFEAGQLYEVPHGWASALYAAYDEEATIPQHMLLSINARMSHDLPLLLRSGPVAIRGNRVRHADLEQWRRLFDTAIEGVGASLVRKYRLETGRLNLDITLPDRLLDLDFLDDIEFLITTEAGLSEPDGHDGSQEIAIDAAVKAHEVLTRQHINSPDIIAALKHIEARYTGRWSDWI
jgi:hypothetical protein